MSDKERANAPSAAVALRLAGASYDEIATTLGYASEETARAAVERFLADYAKDADPEDRNRLRAQNGARLERLLRGVWVKATDPSHPEHLAAVSKALSIIERHNRLYGLDAPTEVTVYTPAQREIDAFVAEVLARQQESFDVVEAQVVIEGELDDDQPAISA